MLGYKYQIEIIFDAIFRPKIIKAKLKAEKKQQQNLHYKEILDLQLNWKHKLEELAELNKPVQKVITKSEFENPIVIFPIVGEDMRPYCIEEQTVTIQEREVKRIEIPLLNGNPMIEHLEIVARELARKLIKEGYVGFKPGRGYRSPPHFYFNTFDM